MKNKFKWLTNNCLIYIIALALGFSALFLEQQCTKKNPNPTLYRKYKNV